MNSGKWQYACANSGTESTADSGVTVVANTWYTIGLTVNAAGNQVDFTVNGAGAGQITTNIPTPAVRIGAGAEKSLGTTVESVGLIDFIWCEAGVTR